MTITFEIFIRDPFYEFLLIRKLFQKHGAGLLPPHGKFMQVASEQLLDLVFQDRERY